jgi:precorrin-2 dehydrogenase/sirohydrochlorin ferrochelatase
LVYYPALLDLNGRLAVLIGGGRVAARKLASLLEAGARVRLAAPKLDPRTEELAASPQVELLRRGFEPGDLDGACLAVCATDDQELNRMVAAEADRRGLFVNVVDVPSLCSFIVPAVVRRGELTLAVSTGGASPAAARRLREGLQDSYGPAWGPYLRLMRVLRRRVMARGRPAEENRPLFFALADSELFEMVAAGDAEGVDRVIARVLGPGFGLADMGWGPEDLRPRRESS